MRKLSPAKRQPCFPKVKKTQSKAILKDYSIGLEKAPPYPSMTLHNTLFKSSENVWVEKNYETGTHDHIYDAPQACAEESPWTVKVWDVPFEKVTSEGLLNSLLQNEAARQSFQPRFVNESIVYKVLANSGVPEAFQRFGIDRVAFRGIVSIAFRITSSGRPVISSTYCVIVFFHELAEALKKEIKKVLSISSRVLWHIILSAIYFFSFHETSMTFVEKKKKAIMLSKDFIKKEIKPAWKRKVIFMKA